MNVAVLRELFAQSEGPPFAAARRVPHRINQMNLF